MSKSKSNSRLDRLDITNDENLSPQQQSVLKNFHHPTVSTIVKRQNPSQIKDKIRILSKQLMDVKDNLDREQKAFEHLDSHSKKLTQVLDEEIKAIKNAFSTLADATMEEVDVIKNSIQLECVERLGQVEKSLHDNQQRKEEVQVEISNLKERVSELTNDSQKKFQRVDFDISNMRSEMKDLATKNVTFRNDVMGAIREIKDICWTNSSAINKLAEDVKVIRDDMNQKLESANKLQENNAKELGDMNVDLSNFKSITEKEIFDVKSECGFLNKSVKKVMQESEQSIISQRQNQERQQEFFTKKIDSFFEKIEHIHSGMEKKIDAVDREFESRRDQDEGTRKLLYKQEEKLDKIDTIRTDLSNVQNKVNAQEELMGLQRSELFKAMSEFETNVLKKHETVNRAFKQISNDLNVANPMVGSSFY